jgi:hypothetical protein
MKPGFTAEGGETGPRISPAHNKGAHGYAPGSVNMDSAFAALGPVIAQIRLPRGHIVDIAPTVANLLGLTMDHVEGFDLLSESVRDR